MQEGQRRQVDDGYAVGLRRPEPTPLVGLHIGCPEQLGRDQWLATPLGDGREQAQGSGGRRSVVRSPRGIEAGHGQLESSRQFVAGEGHRCQALENPCLAPGIPDAPLPHEGLLETSAGPVRVAGRQGGPAQHHQGPGDHAGVPDLSSSAERLLDREGGRLVAPLSTHGHAEVDPADGLEPLVVAASRQVEGLLEQSFSAVLSCATRGRTDQHQAEPGEEVVVAAVVRQARGDSLVHRRVVALVERTLGDAQVAGCPARVGEVRQGCQLLQAIPCLVGEPAYLPEPPEPGHRQDGAVRVVVAAEPCRRRLADVGQLGLDQVQPAHLVGSAQLRLGFLGQVGRRRGRGRRHPLAPSAGGQPAGGVLADRLQHREAGFVPGCAGGVKQVGVAQLATTSTQEAVDGADHVLRGVDGEAARERGQVVEHVSRRSSRSW